METATISPLERAIAAIAEVRGPDLDRMIVRSERKKIARAVLQALREPSEAMLEGFGIHKSRARQNYQAMIDAALSE